MRALPLVLAVAAAIACAPKGRDIRLERLDAQHRNLEATFDRLEDRLTTTQARVRFWQEMRARHESVAAIACASLDAHAVAMAQRLEPARSSLHRSRVATASESRTAARVSASRD